MGRMATTVPALVAVLCASTSAALAQPRWGSAPQPRAGVCFYEDVNFRGQYFCVRAGDALERMPAGLGDRISSIRVFGFAAPAPRSDRAHASRVERGSRRERQGEV